MWQYNYSPELYHYGVMGMKWGHRKQRQPIGFVKRVQSQGGLGGYAKNLSRQRSVGRAVGSIVGSRIKYGLIGSVPIIAASTAATVLGHPEAVKTIAKIGGMAISARILQKDIQNGATIAGHLLYPSKNKKA